MRAMSELPVLPSSFDELPDKQKFKDDTFKERMAGNGEVCGREHSSGRICTRASNHAIKRSKDPDPGTMGGLHIAGSGEHVLVTWS